MISKLSHWHTECASCEKRRVNTDLHFTNSLLLFFGKWYYLIFLVLHQLKGSRLELLLELTVAVRHKKYQKVKLCSLYQPISISQLNLSQR